jgi:hypothetical protein
VSDNRNRRGDRTSSGKWGGDGKVEVGGRGRKTARRGAEAGSRGYDRKYERQGRREKRVERDDRVRNLLMKRSAGKNRDGAAGGGNEGESLLTGYGLRQIVSAVDDRPRKSTRHWGGRSIKPHENMSSRIECDA